MKNMKVITHTNVKAMTFTPDEIDILKGARRILQEAQFKLGDDHTLISLETGEVVIPGEINRTRAILDFFATYRMIEVNPQ